MEKKLPGILSGLCEEWEGEGPLRLMFQDEARFGLISESRRCWCPAPYRPLCPSLVSQQYVYAYGAVSLPDGQLDSLVCPQVNTACMQVFLNEISRRYPKERIVMVLDGAGWHKSHELKPPRNMQLLILPAYSPELNPVEHIWDELREKYFHNLVFESLDALEEHLLQGLRNLENKRETTRSIAAWPWIIDAIPM